MQSQYSLLFLPISYPTQNVPDDSCSGFWMTFRWVVSLLRVINSARGDFVIEVMDGYKEFK